MSTFCAIVTALALPVGGCAEEAPIRVPDGDRAAFSYEKPEPPAPPPAPEPAPVQEPRTIIQIVPAPAPSLPPEPVPEPVPAPEPEIVMVELPAPDPAALRLAATTAVDHQRLCGPSRAASCRHHARSGGDDR